MKYEDRIAKINRQTVLNFPDNPWETDFGFEDFIAANFWQRVEIGSDDECWPWLRYCEKPSGYGSTKILGRMWKTHQIAWLLANDLSKIPEGIRLFHVCKSPSCCNPNHIGSIKNQLRTSPKPILKEDIILEFDEVSELKKETKSEKINRLWTDLPERLKKNPEILEKIKERTPFMHDPEKRKANMSGLIWENGFIKNKSK